MKKTIVMMLGLVALLVLGSTLLNSLGSQARLDLTEQGLYSLSKGTKNIARSVEQPLVVSLYFSRSASQDLTQLRAYSQRVEELLREYELLSQGNIQVRVIDPVPFSDAEDDTTRFGLQGVPLGAQGDRLYFGLVVQRANDPDFAAVLPFLQPNREVFLEYEITQLLYQVQREKAPVIGLMTGLNVLGEGREQAPWVAIEQLQTLYELRSLSNSLEQIDQDVDLLLLIQPPELTPATLYAIDQFALRGGRVLAFVDPLAEAAPAGGMLGVDDAASSNSLVELLAHWGVGFDPQQVVLDEQQALVVSQGQGRPPLRHLGILSVTPDHMDSEAVMTAQLEAVNLSSAGQLTLLDSRTTDVQPWLFSSMDSGLVATPLLGVGVDLIGLQRQFVNAQQEHNLAVSVTGRTTSLFPQGLDGQRMAEHLEDTEKLAVTVIADTDVLSDRLWVRVQSFFGERMAQPWADNGSLLLNLADHLSGSADLMSLRARGQFSRPFERVSELRRVAEQRFLASEQRLQQQLEDTEAQLRALSSDNPAELNAEQQATLMAFQQQKLQIRKELRAVQHELNKDIEALGTRLKVVNIFVWPLALTLMLALAAWGWRRRHNRL